MKVLLSRSIAKLILAGVIILMARNGFINPSYCSIKDLLVVLVNSLV